MLRLLAVIAAATARPNTTEYFDVSASLWPPTTAAGRCLAAQRWLARLRAYAASDARPADGGFDGVARACTDGDDRACAAAWRMRAEVRAAVLGRKHPTVVPRLLATCA